MQSYKYFGCLSISPALKYKAPIFNVNETNGTKVGSTSTSTQVNTCIRKQVNTCTPTRAGS